jgi:hypothetical protein
MLSLGGEDSYAGSRQQAASMPALSRPSPAKQRGRAPAQYYQLTGSDVLMRLSSGAARACEDEDGSSLLASRSHARFSASSSLRDAGFSAVGGGGGAAGPLVRQPAFAGLAESMLAAVPYRAPRPEVRVVASLSEASLEPGAVAAGQQPEVKPIDFSKSLSLAYLHTGSKRQQAALRRGGGGAPGGRRGSRTSFSSVGGSSVSSRASGSSGSGRGSRYDPARFKNGLGRSLDLASASNYAGVMGEAARVKSSVDACCFFYKDSGQGLLDFFEMRRAADAPGAPPSDEFRPYDIEAKGPDEPALPPPHGKRNASEQFTVSGRGLVHRLPAEPTTFTGLPDWMKGLSVFNSVAAIDYFRNFLRRKYFWWWRDGVRYKLFLAKRAETRKLLFLAHAQYGPALRDCAREARGMVVATKLTDGLPPKRRPDKIRTTEAEAEAADEAAMDAAEAAAAEATAAAAAAAAAAEAAPVEDSHHVEAIGDIEGGVGSAKKKKKKGGKAEAAMDTPMPHLLRTSAEMRPYHLGLYASHQDHNTVLGARRMKLCARRIARRMQRLSAELRTSASAALTHRRDVLDRYYNRPYEAHRPQLYTVRPPPAISLDTDAKATQAALRAGAAFDVARLGDFVRLVDLMMLGGAMEAGTAAVRELALEAEYRARAKGEPDVGLFSCEVDLKWIRQMDGAAPPLELHFTPSQHSVADAYERQVADVLLAMDEMPRLVHRPPAEASAAAQASSLEEEEEKEKEEEEEDEEEQAAAKRRGAPPPILSDPEAFVVGLLPPLDAHDLAPDKVPLYGNVARNDKTFAEWQQRARQAVSEDFGRAHEYASIFEPVRGIMHFDREWDEDAMRGRKESLEQYAKELQQLATWEAGVNRIKPQAALGVLNIDAIALKAKLYDKNTAKFKWLKEACLAFARRFCSATTVGLNQRLRPTEMRKRVKEMGLSRASSATGARKQSTSERRRIANSSAEEQAAEAKRQELEQVRVLLEQQAARKTAVETLGMELQKARDDALIVHKLYKLLHAFGVRLGMQDSAQREDLNEALEKYLGAMEKHHDTGLAAVLYQEEKAAATAAAEAAAKLGPLREEGDDGEHKAQRRPSLIEVFKLAHKATKRRRSSISFVQQVDSKSTKNKDLREAMEHGKKHAHAAHE